MKEGKVMITIYSPVMADKIQEVVENIEDPKYTFIKKEGMKLYFEVDEENKELAAEKAKSAIKATPFGKAIMFKVDAEDQ